ncbi:MAG: hypothetical protein QOH11_1520 [Solirubrobacteraceae bacterium]|nr:hypothetical protein [Solirubrobacteraceae bacterium]
MIEHGTFIYPLTGAVTPPGTPSMKERVHNGPVHIERRRENVFTVTVTSEELSALVAGARMALEAMRSAPEPPPAAALEVLEHVLADFDRARQRLHTEPPPGG